MGVSKNNCTPKSFILIGFSYSCVEFGRLGYTSVHLLQVDMVTFWLKDLDPKL